MKIHVLGLMIVTGLMVGCAYPTPSKAAKVIYDDQIVEVPTPLPPDREEVIPPPPGEKLVWVKGHWKWEGTEWVWKPGHYIEKPHPEAAWVPGHYVQKSYGLVYVPGHWD